jgi:hypothetical protein
MQIIYYQYVVKKGKKAEYTTRMKKAIDAVGGEGSGKIPNTRQSGDGC